MDVEAVMEELAEQLGTIVGLRVHGQPPDDITPPAAVVGYPEVDFDQTYCRGMDRWNVPVWVVVGRDDVKAARRLLSPYVSGSGDKSIKATIDGGTYVECDVATVQSGRITIVTIGGAEYLAAEFTVDIAGSGV